MIATDEDALICDLAETYQIYDYKSLPASRVAIFAVGLRENSRIKLKMNEQRVPLETALLALLVDRVTLLAWLQSEDGAAGRNRPNSITGVLLGTARDEEINGFDTVQDFESARERIVKKGGR